MAIHREFVKLSVEHMKDLKIYPLEELQKHFDIINHVIGDKLFMATGVINDDLSMATSNLGLEIDPEYL